MAVIRVSGHQGSGKTTVCKRLAEALGYNYIYVGGIFRKKAEAEGKEIEQYYDELGGNPELEKKVDSEIAALLNENDCQIVEGRMAPFWPTPFEKVNVLFTIDPVEGAKRQQKRSENAHLQLSDMMQLSAERLANERSRYKKLYHIDDFLDEKH